MGNAAESIRHGIAATDIGPCIPYAGYIDKNGYGLSKFGRKKFTTAHRVVCEKAHGPPPSPRHQAAHSCRLRSCVRAAHVSWKTAEENCADKALDGTQLMGEQVHTARLTESDVLLVRRSPKSHADLARRFDVSATTISSARSGKTWKHLEG